jgi:hypothetical protein
MPQPNYATEFPREDIARAMEILRSGTAASYKSALHKSGWRVESYAVYLLMGDPDVPADPSHVKSLAADVTDADIHELGLFIGEIETSGTKAGQMALDPGQIAGWIQIILPIAKQLLEWLRARRPAP